MAFAPLLVSSIRHLKANVIKEVGEQLQKVGQEPFHVSLISNSLHKQPIVMRFAA